MIAQFFDSLVPWRQKIPSVQPPVTPPTVGSLIGPFGRKLCWEATGSPRDLYQKSLGPQITKYLDDNFGCVPGDDHITISMYMTGDSAEKALPTLLFISKNPGTRKEAREAIKTSGIMSRYPDFRVKYVSKDPGFHKLETLASSEESLCKTTTLIESTTEVLYDETQPFRTIGMPIYIRHSTSLRTATANVVRVGAGIFLQTASHAFYGNMPIAVDPIDSASDELEIDSDSESSDGDEDDANVAITSIASQSPDSWSDQASSAGSGFSRRSSLFSDAATPTVKFSPLDNRIALDEANAKLVDESLERKIFAPKELKSPPKESLRPLGHLHCGSVDHDFALIKITNETVVESLLSSLQSMEEPLVAYSKIASGPRDGATIHSRTASGYTLTGTLSGTPSFMRLPHGSSFQDVYTVRISGSIFHGICGSVIVDSSTGETYGHVVAGCRTTSLVYVVAAKQVAHFLSRRSLEFIPSGYPSNGPYAELRPHSESNVWRYFPTFNVGQRTSLPLQSGLSCVFLFLSLWWQNLSTYTLYLFDALRSPTLMTISEGPFRSVYSFLKKVIWPSALGPHRPRIKSLLSASTLLAYVSLLASTTLLYSIDTGYFSSIQEFLDDRAYMQAFTYEAPPSKRSTPLELAWCTFMVITCACVTDSLILFFYSSIYHARGYSQMTNFNRALVSISFGAIWIAVAPYLLQLLEDLMHHEPLIFPIFFVHNLFIICSVLPENSMSKLLFAIGVATICFSPAASIAQHMFTGPLPTTFFHLTANEEKPLLIAVMMSGGTLIAVWATRTLLRRVGVSEHLSSGIQESISRPGFDVKSSPRAALQAHRPLQEVGLRARGIGGLVNGAIVSTRV
jgi:hypothetical protein